MNPRRAWTWIIFWAGVCIVVGTLSWASYSVYELEERNAMVKADAQRQELIRLALWRIDSRIAPIIALEASRPYTEYEQLQISPDDLFRNAGLSAPSQTGFAGQPQSFARQYFQYENPASIVGLVAATERQQSPQPTQTLLTSETLTEGSRDDQSEITLSGSAGGGAAQSEQKSKDGGYDFEARKAIADIANQNRGMLSSDENSAETERARAKKELEPEADEFADLADDARSDDADTAIWAQRIEQDPSITNRSGAIVGGLTPQWMIGEDGSNQLVLVRTITVDGNTYTQGVWLDWAAMSEDLLSAVHDIQPTAQLIPSAQPSARESYPLATIPAVFIPGGALSLPAQSLTPAMIAMMVTWIAIIVAIASIGFVLRAAIKLSERRGRFVTAVTHELRTPLTTFRLYSQMLADGMVPDDTVREQYLTTLKRESERLTGIVENVLEYARLSRRRSTKDTAAGVQSLTPDALLVRFRPALSRRAEQSNMDLVTSIDLMGFEDRTLTVDPQAVERIMMNLIENACKYASMPEDLDASKAEEFDTRIHLDATISDGILGLLIADHGPGIEPGERARIFGEFQRGARRKILNRSGLGLGLALSRGLAREMGGDLQLVSRRGHGAEFLFTIPLDDAISVS